MTTSMRRVALAAAAVVLGISCLSACATKIGTGRGGANTITVLHTPDDRAGLDAAVAAFEKANPGKHVRVVYQGTDQLGVSLQSQLSAGTAPDILPVQPGIAGSVLQNGVLVRGGYLSDLSDHTWSTQLPDDLKPLLLVKGKLYQFPAVRIGIGAIYNRTAMSAAGLEPPSTYPDVLDFCRAARAKGKVAYSLGLATQYVTQLIPYAFAASTVFAKNPRFSADQAAGKVTFSDSGWRRAYEHYLEMNREGCFSKDPLGTSVDVSLQAVARGDALSVVQVGTQLGVLQGLAPRARFEVLPLPGTDDAKGTWVTASPGVGYGIYRKSSKQDLAGQFLDFLARPSNNNAYATKLGVAPAIPNDQFRPAAALRTFAGYVDSGRSVPFPGNLWPNPKVQQANFDGIQALFLDKLDVGGLLKSLDDAYAGD